VIVLDIQLKVSPTQEQAFLDMYHQEYVPALRRQTGYLGSLLLRVFPPDVTAEIGATAPQFDISLRLQFDTEENRRRWVASDDHQRVWPQALELSRQAEWVGYEVIGRDGE
jgi:antibiotic biosynthesis monooxygenase (ABM) superfamily enzyme